MAQPAPAREPNIPAPYVDIYKDGEYLKKNPTWHVEESPFKAKYILEMLRRNNLSPRTVCEAGCGAGEVLRQLQLQMGADHEFWDTTSPPRRLSSASLGQMTNCTSSLRILAKSVESASIFFWF